MEENQRLNCITAPHAHDVLSGRGNLVNRHPGNEHFRSLIKRYKEEYVACHKSRKSMYSKLIYDEIRSLDPPGRFLKQDSITKLWNEIGKKMALAKTRQALREGAPELLRDLQTFEQFRLHSTSESDLAHAANVGICASNIDPPVEPSNHTMPILSKYLRRSSSAESMGAESVLSLDSMNNGKKNAGTQLTMHNQVSSRFAEVPSYATWMASSNNSGEGTSALLQVGHSANQMLTVGQPSNPWQHLSTIPSMLQNCSTQAPESQCFALLNTVNDVNQQRNITANISRDSFKQFTNSKCFENAPWLNSAATSHQQQCNIINNVSGNGNASINEFTIRTGIRNAPFVNSAPSSHQHQYNIINNLSGNHNASMSQFTINTGTENAPFVNSTASPHQQQYTMINNISGNGNTNCLLPMLAGLSSNNSNMNNTRCDTQLLNYQLAYQHLLSKWNAQQNTALEVGDETGCTPFQNSRAKSA